MNKQIRRIAITIIVGASVILALYIFGCNRRFEEDSGYRLVMGTFAHLKAIAKDPQTAKRCVQVADAFKRAVKVSASTFEVLQRSTEFSRLSGGAFDITIAPLTELWRTAAEVNSVPTEAVISEARSKVGYEKLILDANEMTVRFAVDGMKLDLGGIAKGYSIDKAIEAMQVGGAIGGMVDVGGDIRCFGLPPKGKKTWRIGLQDPAETDSDEQTLAGARDQVLMVLKLTNAAIATSGGYRRFVLIEGKRYSHIINRDTATSAEGLSSVTIISQNALDADALATSVSVMGPEKGLALIEKIPNTEPKKALP
ncbi:MAG: FAD:protein FMN transferase [Planctomycetota bacterium]|jgi:thiamine biosynthesis lipoprotein